MAVSLPVKFPLLLLLATTALAKGQIYADVSTSLGGFTIRLNELASPQTVANFITLAEGSRPWIDHATGAVHSAEPFYNGVTFHRVIANFMSQTGSRKGDGTDGPGYTFRDELNNGLQHSGPHVVSMANSGPNSNGSQFFITDAATPHLDGKHTVFGVVSSGQAVVNTINDAPTTNEKPNTPVVIQTIAIRREGAAAAAFNALAQLLPVIDQRRTTLQVQPGGSASITLAPPLSGVTRLRVHRSLDLGSWNFLGTLALKLDDSPVALVTGIETNAPPKAFYHLPVTAYPDDQTFSDPSRATYQLFYTDEQRTYTFNPAGSGGSVTITPTAGTPSTIPFTLIDSGYSLYSAEFIIDHGVSSSPRYLHHTLDARFSPTARYLGKATSYEYLGNWFPWKSGTFTATR